MASHLSNRLEKLESITPASAYDGAVRFIWHGPEDDAALAEVERQAKATNQRVVQRVIVGQRKPDAA